MSLSWDELRLFLAVARLGGLSAAAEATGLSPATLGRKMTALETALGQPLFVRSPQGYRLTAFGEDLLGRADEVDQAMAGLERWRQGSGGARVVRVSAGAWTSAFLGAHIEALWRVEDRFTLDLVTASAKVDIGRRAADIGIRNARPTERWLAGRRIGRVTFALYCGRRLVNGVAAGMFVGVSGDSAETPSARWLNARHGDRIAVRGNDPMSVRELAAAGAGLAVLPCFIGDGDARLVRVAPPIAELTSEQWLVTHHEGRQEPEVAKVAERIAALMHDHVRLFRGEMPLP
jgi:DNA-binding transcriptional LysR family regulator